MTDPDHLEILAAIKKLASMIILALPEIEKMRNR